MAIIAFYFALSWAVGAMLIAVLRVKLPWRLPRAVRMVPLALVGAFFFVPVVVNSVFFNVPLPIPALVIDAVTGRTTPLNDVLSTAALPFAIGSVLLWVMAYAVAGQRSDRRATAAAVLAMAASRSNPAASAHDEPMDDGSVYEPGAGTRGRERMLDAVRGALQSGARFRVHHLKSDGRFAYFRGTEVVELDLGELQETDLSVEALLERGPGNSWVVLELWAQPNDAERPRDEFMRRVAERRDRGNVAAEMFPHAAGLV